jgi:hypothetical protein
MPYKNPEDKRRWEREHREERNARRRLNPNVQSAYTPVPDPAPANEKSSGWKILASIAVGIGVAFLAALAGVSQIDGGTPGSGQGQ